MDIPDGYQALRERAGIVDRSARGKIVVAGADRASYLHALFTNDISGLQPGRGCYSVYLTPQGRMIADVRVLNLGDLLLLDLDARVKDDVLQRLDQFIFSEDVKLGDVTDAWAALEVSGPEAAQIVAKALGAQDLGEDDSRLQSEYDNRRLPFGASMIVVAATREHASAGFDLYVERDQLATLRAALIIAGAEEVSEQAAAVARIERGRPAFLADMDHETIPLEAGIEPRAISFTKGCYVGQEVIIRVVSRGHGRVAKKLVGLRIDGGDPAAPGDELWAGDRRVGKVTSSVASPALDQPIALGYVHRDFTAAGTEVTVAHGDARVRAVVADLPFVSA